MTIYTSGRTGIKENVLYPNKVEVDNLKDFKEAVKFDHVFAQFKENKRANQNFIEGDCLFGDIDNSFSENPNDWITISDFKQKFFQYEFYLATSKSHQKIKDGRAPRDKFHVYFPIHKIKDVEKLKYWLSALTTKYSFFDKQVKDAGRFFFGNDSQVFHSAGRKSIIEDLKGFKPEPQVKEHIPLEFDLGNRNDTMFRWACSLHSNGCSDDEIRIFLDGLNDKLSEQLDDREIDTIIKSTHRFEISNPKSFIPQEEKTFIKNYYRKNTGEKDKEGNDILKTKYYDDFSEMDTAAEYFISLKDGSGKKFLLDGNEPESIITKPAEVKVKLMSKKVYMDFAPNGLTEIEYLEWLKENSKQIERLSITPEMIEDNKTKYIAPILQAEKTGYFRGLIDLMTFKTLKDKYRFAAGLLSMYLPASFDGRKPLFSVLADSPSSGKTAAVRIGVKCAQGLDPIDFIGDKDDEQQLSGVKPLSNKAVLYDNLQYIDRKQLLTITKTITDNWIPAWFFGVSHARVRNNKTFFATFNTEESINTDVLNRILTIHMKDGRDINDEKKLELQTLLNKISKEKHKVQQDIRWALEQTSKDIKIKHHPKFVEWGVEVVKLLQHFFPEVNEFDFSLSEDDKELSSDSVMFDEFVQELLGNSTHVFIPNEEMVDKYREFYRRPSASKSEATRKIRNMQKSFTHKYNIEAGKLKKIANIVRRGVEITSSGNIKVLPGNINE